MNKTELIKALSEESGLTNKDSHSFLTAFEKVMTQTLSAGDTLNLIGFGSFCVKERSARTARNFQTGKDIAVPASKTVKLKVGARLKDAVNI